MKLSIPYRAVPLLLVVNTFRPRQTWNSDSNTGEDLPLVTDSGGASGLDKVTNAAKYIFPVVYAAVAFLENS